jgi:LysM repeat protein
MKLVFLFIAILINFFNHSLIKSEEKIDSVKNITENITKKESIAEDKNGIRKIHIVKIGDTISSISKFYSINKDLIIKLNNLKDENYIYVGQNLIISKSSENSIKKSDLANNYHIVQIGENLTDISNKYNLKLANLIEINNLKDPDSIKVGGKILLSINNPISSENSQIMKNKKNKKNNKLRDLNRQVYGPIIIQSRSYSNIKGRKVLNVFNQENRKLILSISCDKNELDVRIPGRKWRGVEPAKEEFEKNLIKDFC